MLGCWHAFYIFETAQIQCLEWTVSITCLCLYRIIACQLVTNTFAATNDEGNLIKELMHGYER